MKQNFICAGQNFALILLLLLVVTIAIPAHAESTKLTFLHTNDMGELTAKKGFGGFPQLATLLKTERTRSPHSITTFGGDLISPSLMSGLSKGVEMIQMMNAIKMDVAVFGNHEFDFGPEVTKNRVAESAFPWLGTNIQEADGAQFAGAKAYLVKDVAGYKVGFFGLTTPETVSLSSPGENVVFIDVIEAAKKAVSHLKSDGADIIVALTHMDLSDDIRLAKEVKGLHLILGGHDHRTFASVENGVAILQAGSDLRYLGVLDLIVEHKEKRGKKYLSVIPSWKILTTAGVAADQSIETMVQGLEETLDEKLNIVVGKSELQLDTRRMTVRTKQTKFGELIALAMKREVGADFGFTNGGGIRGDREYGAGSELTRKDILKELPFGNVTVLLEISGENVRQLVEHGVSKVEEGAGRFGQYSGLSYDFDATKLAGSRVGNISIKGSPLDPSKIYTIATNDYVARGGDGFAMLPLGKVIIDKSAGTLMATTVMKFIQDNDGVTASLFK
ncbi:MAG: bifunctional metallophosphatase/5'-nucleotidase [Sneathiella sp.]|nr:bifunctional metallophosphatase/5'-nucleotidase [Sneathiella sp.]